MDIRLKIALEVFVIIYFFIIYRFLKKKNFILKYSLLWIAAGFSMAVFIIFPHGLSKITTIFGIATPVNGLFVISFIFVIIILMSLTGIVSRQTHRIKELTQNTALMEKRIRELEYKIVEKEKDEFVSNKIDEMR